MIIKIPNSSTHVVFVHPPRSSGTSIEHCLLLGDLVADHHKHLNAKQIREALGEASWGSAYKFGLIRSPWERMASWYVTEETPYRSYNIHSGNSMMEFLLRYKSAPWEHGLQCCDYLNEELDYIIRYEDREAGIQEVNKHLKVFGLSIDPSVKKRANKKNQQDMLYYDDNSLAWIADNFKGDIQKWYSPE